MRPSRFEAWLTPERRIGLPLLLMVVPAVFWLAQTTSSLKQEGLSKTSGDFSAFYMAGQFFLAGQLDEIYAPGAQENFQRARESTYAFGAQEQLQRAKGDYHTAGFLAFISPPFAAVLFIPLAWLPPAIALSVWRLIGIFALYGSIRLLQGELPALGAYKASRLVMVCFLFYPTLHWFILGQATSIVLFLYTSCFVHLRRKQDLKAGFFLGLLLFKPQLGLWPALLLCYRRRWWAILGGALSVSIWLIVGSLLSPAAMWSFLALSPKLLQFIRSESFHTWGLMSLYGFGAVLVDGVSRNLGGALGWLLTGIGGLLFLSFWRGDPWEPKSKAWALRMAASFALAPLLSPHLFAYDLMLLLLPFAILSSLAPELWRRPRFLLGSSLLWLAAFLTLYLSAITVAYLRFGVQWVTLLVVWWSWAISRHAREPEV